MDEELVMIILHVIIVTMLHDESRTMLVPMCQFS